MAINSLPSLLVQIAFNPTNLQSLPGTQTWTDVTQYVRSFQTLQGRQHYLNRVEAGTLSMTVDNRNGFFFNPAVNATSPGAVLQPRLPIKITATYPASTGTPYSIFYGIIDSIDERVTDQLNSDLTIRATDLLKFLSLQSMSSNKFWDTYARSTSATNWFRCDVTKVATVTNAVTPSAIYGFGYTDYTSINNFSVGQSVYVKGITTYSGADQFSYSNASVVAASASSFTLSTGNSPGTAGGQGTATQTDTTDQIYTGSGNTAYYVGDVGFNANGAIVYSANGSINLANGSNAGTGYMQISDVPSATSGALDFWILGQGIAGQQITTVLAGGYPGTRCQLWVSSNGKIEAVLQGATVGGITDASASGTQFTFTGSFGSGRINVGDYVKVTGLTAAYNGTWKVYSYSSTTLVVTAAGTPAAIHSRAGAAVPVFRTNVTVNDGYWHHVGFCNDAGGNLNVYADGTLVPIVPGSTSYNGWSTYASSGGGAPASQALIIGSGNTVFGEPQTYNLAALIDEVIISNNSNYSGSALYNELLNRYRAGTMLSSGFPVTSNKVLSGDRVAEILCLAGFGHLTNGNIVLNSNTYYINDSGTAWVNGLLTNGFTYVEPWYWDSPVTGSTALDLINQICETDIGSFYQETNGTLSYYNQNYYGTWAWPAATWTPNNVYVPAPTGDHIWTDDASSTYAYYGPSLQVVRDDVDAWTTVKVTPQSGSTQVYENSGNEARWGYTTLSKSATLHTSLDLALSTATFLGTIFATPLPRVTNVELRSETNNGGNMTALLNTEFGDIVTFKRRSPNASTTGTYPSSKGAISVNMIVESISHDFQAEPGTWHTSFILDPYPVRS